MQFKDFLEKLTPPEWFEEQRRVKRERQEKRRHARMHAKRQAWEVRSEWDSHIEHGPC
jgi:hypothetical protein